MSISLKCECLQGSWKTLIKCFRGTGSPPSAPSLFTAQLSCAHFCGLGYFCASFGWDLTCCGRGPRNECASFWNSRMVPIEMRNVVRHFEGNGQSHPCAKTFRPIFVGRNFFVHETVLRLISPLFVCRRLKKYVICAIIFIGPTVSKYQCILNTVCIVLLTCMISLTSCRELYTRFS